MRSSGGLGSGHYIIEERTDDEPKYGRFLDTIDQVNADIFSCFPNNKNIILGAQQAMHLTRIKGYCDSFKDSPSGITAIINYVAGRRC